MWEEFAKLFYLIWGGIAIYTGIIAWTNDKRLSGTSRFSKSLKSLEGTDGIILSKNHQLSFNKSKEGIIIIAPTGEGKTFSALLPNLLTNCLPKSSIVIADIKGELWDLSSEYQRSIGRIPMRFSPLGKDEGICYNILANCHDFTEIRAMATDILSSGSSGIRAVTGSNGGSEATWINLAIPLFTAALLYCRHKTINAAVKLLINSNLEILTAMFKTSKDEDIREQFNIFMSSAGCEAEMSGIFSTLTSNVQLYTDHYLIKNTCKNDFTPEDLRNKPIALYIQYTPSKANYLAPYLSVFYSQLINHIEESKGLSVVFMLDEFQNLGKIPNFTDIVSHARSSNIIFLLSIQSMNKLYEMYGMNNIKNMLGNIKTKLVLASNSELDTLDTLSRLCGYTTIIDKTKVKTRLLEDDEIRRLGDNDILILAHNKLPIIDKKYHLDL